MRNLAVILFWASVLVAVTFALLPHPPRVPGEPSDKIQHIIAFTEDPNYRAFMEATELLFINAIVLGPVH